MNRDTTSGIKFEKAAMLNRTDGLNWSKGSFCSSFKKYFNIDPINYLSWRFQPDEAYYFPKTNELIIYEKKTQHVSGSADNKLPACGWWYSEYKRLADAAGISKVSYIFILDDWFKQDRYKTMLKVIENTPGCSYVFWSTERDKLGLK